MAGLQPYVDRECFVRRQGRRVSGLVTYTRDFATDRVLLILQDGRAIVVCPMIAIVVYRFADP